MSHVVRFNFRRLAYDCYVVCDNAYKRIAGIESQLEYLEKLASEGLDGQTQRYVQTVRRSMDNLRNQVERMRLRAKDEEGLANWKGDSDSYIWENRYDLKDLAYSLLREVNRQVASYRPAINGIIDELKATRRRRHETEFRERKEAIQRQIEARNRKREETRRRNATLLDSLTTRNKRQQEEREAVRNDSARLDSLRKKQAEERRQQAEAMLQEQEEDIRNQDILNELIDSRLGQQEKKSNVWDKIEDANLRQFTYMAHLTNPDLDGDALLAEGQRMYDTVMERKRQEEIEAEQRRAREEMEAAKLPQAEIERVLKEQDGTMTEQLERLYANTSEAIIGESIRKKTLQIVRKAIMAQGFIVDSKNIRKDGDVVTMIAQKAGGELAKFTVYLDGKFIYDFGGYEGQACQKDIEPFMRDLRDVYGVELIEREEIWRNPDKDLTQKKQVMNSDHKTR